MKTPTQHDIVYMAGLFDGEGCVVIAKHHRRKDGTYNYELRVDLVNTWLDIFPWIRDRFDGRFAMTYDKPPNPIRKPRGDWILTNQKAADFLVMIIPFVKIKRRDMEIGLAFQAVKHGHNRAVRYTPEQDGIMEGWRKQLMGRNKLLVTP